MIHGFDYGNPASRVEIKLYESQRDVCFEIVDNGSGMTQDALQQVLAKKTKGFGIANVGERIKLKYGEEYGVSIASAPGAGANVRIAIPRVEYPEDN